jgi:hypothetical protein
LLWKLKLHFRVTYSEPEELSSHQHIGRCSGQISAGTLDIWTEDFRSIPQTLQASAEIIVLSRDRVTIDGDWIGNWIYCTLTIRDYN